MVESSSGIVNQMMWEQQAADKLGLAWRSILYCQKSKINASIILCPEPGGVGNGGWWGLRRRFYQWLLREQNDWDLILLRHSPSDPLQIGFLMDCGHKTVLVHHAKEIPEILLEKSPVKRLVKASVEWFCGRRSLALAAGVAAVTPEIVSYQISRISKYPNGIPSFVYPNGIFLQDGGLPLEDNRGNVPEILFVASYFSPWQGLDLLLDAVRNSHDDFKLYLVGEVGAVHRDNARLDPRIQMLGPLDNKQISDLSKRCWLGLSSFALSRQGLSQACSLKVREYLNNGIAVYASHDDVFPSDFPYYRNGSVSMGDILGYAYEVRGIAKAEIRKSAEPFISKKKLLCRLYNDILKEFE
jgi:glycosyltransferase involved in cell wall biosynthesis